MLKHLASGGMADVVLGRSDGLEGFERHVVLKRIRPELARDQRFIRMFLDEARVAATLHHQHIVQVHDIGEAAGEYFIAMEYVHGEDVRRILSRASKHRSHVPLGYAVAIVAAAAAGLHYAHERCDSNKQPLGIVHRDVSPSNILVGYDGSIKVVDFGIATASAQQETRTGSLKGKLSYMSPEQCKGEVLDRRSDVYALGVVLYELATTTRMIKGDNDYLVMEQIVAGRISPPRVRRPDLPPELSEIILRALATDRDRRYASADELRVALDQFASKTGLVASTSAIAAFMQQQFGKRPEPWLELDLEPPATGEELPVASDASMLMSSAGWSELPPSDVEPRRTGSVPRATGTQPPAIAALPTTSAETRPPAPRRSRVPREAIIGGVLFAGAMVWLATGVLRKTPDAVAPPPPVAVVRAPAAAPIRETPPPPPAMPPIEPAAPVVAARDVEATRPRKTHLATPTPAPPSPAIRAAAKPPIEVAPPAPKPERPTRLAMVAAPTPPARGDTAAPEPEHPVASPPPEAPPPTPVATPAPAPHAPPAVTSQVVAPAALDANRIAGERTILPDEMTMGAIGRSGNTTLISSYKVCVTAEGAVASVSQLKGTGFAAYDAKIASAIRSDWRYRPFLVNGKATPVCTAFRFIYSQK